MGILIQVHAIWVLVLGILLAYWLGVGMGANDVSNAFDATWGNEIVSVTAVRRRNLKIKILNLKFGDFGSSVYRIFIYEYD